MSPASNHHIAGSRWRFLVPSLAEVLFVALMFWPLMTSADGWGDLLTDTNTGLHIRTGDYVLEHAAVPRTDPYSFSKPGAEWFAFEWLTCVLYSVLYRLFAFRGILVVTAVAFSVFAVVMLRDALLRGGGLLASLGVTLLAFRSSSIHYHARPHVFTLMFLVLAAWWIECDRRKPGRAIWLLVPLTAVWANMHGGFLTLPVYLGLLAAGALGESWWQRRPKLRRQAARYGALSLACAAGSLVNPYGIRLHVHIARFLNAPWLTELVQEYRPPTFTTEPEYIHAILLALGAAVVVFQLRRRNLTQPLLLAFFAYASLKSARHIPIYAAVATPILAVGLTQMAKALAPSRRAVRDVGKSLAGLEREFTPAFLRTSAWSFIVVFALLFADLPFRWPQDFSAARFPVRMAERHADILTSGRLFTRDNWGDYLVWRNYPRQRVFIDGRSDFYGRQIGIDYLTLRYGYPGWQALIERYGFDRMLVPPDCPLTRLPETDPSWEVVDHDSIAWLLVRRARSGTVSRRPSYHSSASSSLRFPFPSKARFSGSPIT